MRRQIRLPGINQFIAAKWDESNTRQRDQLEALGTIRVIRDQSNGHQDGPQHRAEMAKNLRGWSGNLDRMPDRFVMLVDGKLPKEKIRRTTQYGPDGKPLVLNRPSDYRRVTDTDRESMIRYAPIAIGLAARLAQVVGAFGQWAPESINPLERALARSVLAPLLHKLVDDSMSNSLVWGFAPFELVWGTRDLELEVAQGEDADVESAPSIELAKEDGEPVAPPKTPKARMVRFPGATVITKAKDLHPSRTEILVQGDLQEFDGLRYRNDDRQKLTAFQSFVVSHAGKFGQMYGRSILDNCYEHWYAAKAVTMFANRYLERRGDPPYKAWGPVVAQWDENSQAVSGQTIMVEGINKVRSGGAIVMPSDTDTFGNRKYDIELLAEDPRADMFVRYIEWQVKMILWGLLVPDGSVMQSSRVGSFAASQTYADLNVDLRAIDLAWIEGYINKYVVERLMAQNFTSPKQSFIKAKLRPDVKIATLANIFRDMVRDPETGATVRGLADMRDLMRTLNIPIRGLDA